MISALSCPCPTASPSSTTAARSPTGALPRWPPIPVLSTPISALHTMRRRTEHGLELLRRSAGGWPPVGCDVFARRARLRADLQDLRRAELRSGLNGAVRGTDLREPHRARGSAV